MNITSLFTEIHGLCQQQEPPINKVTSLEGRLLTWFQTSAQSVRLDSNRFLKVEADEFADNLILLLAYLACLCLLYRIERAGGRSKALVIAASFIVGILQMLKEKNALRFLPTFAVYYSIYAKKNLRLALMIPHAKISASADLRELDAILDVCEAYLPEARKVLAESKEMSQILDVRPLSDLTPQESDMFGPPFQDLWCRVEV